MKPTSVLLTRVRDELAAGRVWRAKEILRGNLAAGRVEPEVLEAYGQLLERLGERADAGKYFFLSGVRSPDYSDAIALFKKRTAKRRGADFVSLLPAAIRRRSFEELPAVVQRDLRDWGVERAIFGRQDSRWRMSWADRFLLAGVVVVAMLLLLLLALAIGLWTIASWVWAGLS